MVKTTLDGLKEMAEAGSGKVQQSQSHMRPYTFVIEIDRQGVPEQEQLRWRWRENAQVSAVTPPVSGSTSVDDNNTATAVAQELLRFLDSHLLHRESMLGTASAGANVEDQRHISYLVEMYEPTMGGWILLTERTPSENIPRNCRVHVKVDATLAATTSHRKSAHSPPPSSDSRSGDRRPPLSPSTGTTHNKMPADSASSRPIPTVDGFLHRERGPDAVEPTAPREMLALPWRRFDQDLQAGGEEGLEIGGRRVTIGHVSNSSEGTGLFTWDGAVLLAKYLEHQATAMRRDLHDEQQSCGEESGSFSPRNENIGDQQRSRISEEMGGDHGKSSKSGDRSATVRVLELGCGTGMAGLAAAFAFGKRQFVEDGDVQSGGNLCPSSHSSHTPEGEGNEANGYVSPAGKGGGVEVVLTDLEYALGNARANIARNAASLREFGGKVDAMELDWCRPLPQEFVGSCSFDLILAADVVWLDDLVVPLVRTLERLTAGWPSTRTDSTRKQTGSQQPPLTNPSKGARREGSPAEELPVETATEVLTPEKPHHEGAAAVLRPSVERRVLIAYQWRSERTGKALLEKLGAAFHVREIPPEECHPRYLPSSDLCLFEAVRREE